MPEANYKRFSCAHCAKQFESAREKKYCSRKCNVAYLKKIGPQQTRAEYLARITNPDTRFECEHCQKPSRRKLSGTNTKNGHANRWCSMACRVQANQQARFNQDKLDYCSVWTAHCLACQEPFVSKCKRIYCSETCWPKPTSVSTAPAVKRCNGCEAQYVPTHTGGRPSEYCGSVCQAAAMKAVRRINKAKRKAALAGATIERVDPFAVFDRDKWRCQLCGIKTPKSKRGSYDDNAPELDHIVPISKGGAHSYLNTQCSCRQCNIAKSDVPRGQLLLIG